MEESILFSLGYNNGRRHGLHPYAYQWFIYTYTFTYTPTGLISNIVYYSDWVIFASLVTLSDLYSSQVCRWDKNDPKGDHEVIGCQSTVSFTCDTDKPQLEYTAKK